MWGIIRAVLKVPRDTTERLGLESRRPLEMLSEIVACFRGAGCVSGLGLASLSECGLMKTNDLTRSKGWDQGWGILRPSQFPTCEINEGREQPTLCIIYSLRPLNPMSVVCCPPVGLLGTLFTAQTGGCCVADPKLPMFMFDILYQDGCNDVFKQFMTCSTSGYSNQSESLWRACAYIFLKSHKFR